MTISVRLFATLRQLAGWKERLFELPEGATLADLLERLNREQPELTLQTRVVYVAINEEYAKADALLAAGDQVGIFPPVSGGCDWRDGATVYGEER